MKKIHILAIMMGGLGLVGCQQQMVTSESALPTAKAEQPVIPPGKDPQNASYVVEGQVITLVNGKAEMPAAPGSATMVTTTLFGQPTNGELNGDTIMDVAVTLVQSPGGSGAFYYQAAALNKAGEYVGTNAILLGDRVAPQTTQITEGKIIANFAERKEGEPMTANPSVAVSKYFGVQGERLVEVGNPNEVKGQM